MTVISRLALIAALSLPGTVALANGVDIINFDRGGDGGGIQRTDEAFTGVGGAVPRRCPAGTTAQAIFDSDRDGHPVPASVQHVCVGAVDGVVAFTNHSAGTTHGDTFPPSDEVLDLVCGEGDWILFFEEDPQGVPIPGTYEAACLVD